MAYFENTYRFLLDGAQVYPIISDEFNIAWEKEEGSFYFRRQLSSDIKLFGADYINIRDSDIATQFGFIIQKNEGDTWVNYYNGFFFKTDCEFDEDENILTVKPRNNDGWDDVKKVINNEYNLADLAVPTTSFIYKIRPVLQIIYPTVVDDGAGGTLKLGYNRITNVVGTGVYDEVLDQDVTPNDLVDFGFRENIIFNVHRIYTRYLHNNEGLSPSEARRSDDISKTAPYFKYTTDINVSTYIIVGNYQIPAASKYGRVRNVFTDPPPLLCDPDWYYRDVQDLNTDKVLPVTQESWNCPSVWWRVDAALYAIEMNVIAFSGHEIEVSDGYRLSDVIQYLLNRETFVLFEDTIEYSEFLYSPFDPIAGEAYDLFLTPKSNIVNAFHTKAARKAPIRLKDVLDLLSSAFRLYWHLEINEAGNKILRIEHISWYERGGSYGEQSLSLDATTTQDQRNGLPLSYKQNKFSYAKSKMPQRYEFGWDRDASLLFTGFPIKVLDNYIEDGLVEKEQRGLFMPDFDTLIANVDTDLDGFMFFDCEIVDSEYKVKFTDAQTTPTQTLSIQNANINYSYLHPKYHRYGLPSENIKINEEETTALSITRTKQQEFEFAYANITIDPLKLIRTGLGAGQVETMSLNLVSNKFKIVLNHDTE